MMARLPSLPKSQRPTIAVDFDGVIHSYKEWNDGKIEGELMPGCQLSLAKLNNRYRVVVFTARHNLGDVEAWLRAKGVSHLVAEVTNRKPAAVAYIDDRAIHFTTWATTMQEVEKLRG
jgi:hypothetical protein